MCTLILTPMCHNILALQEMLCCILLVMWLILNIIMFDSIIPDIDFFICFFVTLFWIKHIHVINIFQHLWQENLWPVGKRFGCSWNM